MCGIFGVYRIAGGAAIDPHDVELSINVLEHRGPDAGGVYHSEKWSLGSRRLSISDPRSIADQPLFDAKQEYLITYNGEIYNHREIKEELRHKGVAFVTNSDTEVLLGAYRVWGAAAVERIRGIFAFAIIDIRTDELFLARDRLGVKPLFVAEASGHLLFASEIKAILAYPSFTKELNREAISSYLSIRQVLGGETFFTGVKHLAPGHWIRAAKGSLTEGQCGNHSPEFLGSRSSAKFSGIPVLAEAIGEQVRDVINPAIMLSGGLDSSIIACEIAEICSDARCYTACVPGDGYDETEFAAISASRNRQPLDVVRIDSHIDRFAILKLINFRDQPLAMHNELGLFSLAAAISQNSKVVFCGEGADELFSGYGRIFRLPFDMLRHSLSLTFPDRIGRSIRRKLDLPRDSHPIDFTSQFLRRYEYFPLEELKSIATKTYRDKHLIHPRYLDLMHEELTSARANDPALRIRDFFVKSHLSSLLLMLDSVTMANGLEARVPFLDERVVSWALTLSPGQNLKWRSLAHFLVAAFLPVASFSEWADKTKVPLRREYARQIPQQIIKRRKKGFPVPLETALGGQKGWAASEIQQAGARIHEFFDAKLLADWCNSGGRAGGSNFGQKLWQLVNLELFLQAKI